MKKDMEIFYSDGHGQCFDWSLDYIDIYNYQNPVNVHLILLHFIVHKEKRINWFPTLTSIFPSVILSLIRVHQSLFDSESNLGVIFGLCSINKSSWLLLQNIIELILNSVITSILVQTTIKSPTGHFRPPYWSTCSHYCLRFLSQLHYLICSCVILI